MSTKTKIWLITAASFVLIGCIIFGVVMTVLKWDFTKLSTVEYETNEYTINENYKNISVTADTADIVFVPSESPMTSVVCYEQENAKHFVFTEDDTLVIKVVDTREWYEYIGITLGSPKIMVHIPQGEYGVLSVKSSTSDIEIPENFKFESVDISVDTGDVTCLASASGSISIKTSTGDIYAQNISADMLNFSVSTGEVTAKAADCEGDIKIKVSTGDTRLTDISCKSLTTTGSTGDITLKNVIAAEMLSINRSTGHVKFDGCDAAEIFIETDTGRVNGSLLSDKVFITKTDTGRVDVPKTVSGGRCEIVTDTGDIKITVKD